MDDLFAYNPPPWSAARCGDNWDIILPSEPETTGVGVVATCFAGERIGRLIAASPDYAEAAELMIAAERCGGDLWWKGFERLKAAHAKARVSIESQTHSQPGRSAAQEAAPDYNGK